MWLFGLIAGIPGAIIGALTWMAVMALFGGAAPAWLLGFGPFLLLVSVWKIANEGHGSGTIGAAFLAFFGTIGAAVGFLITAVYTLTIGI